MSGARASGDGELGRAAIDRDTEVVVIGAGPAGLAVSACLTRTGIRHLLLEREDRIAPAWRRHYDRLHLHTSRRFSGLPFFPMPRSYPRYPSREQVVDYFEEYARALRLEPRTRVAVSSIRPRGMPATPADPSRWIIESSEGPIRCGSVVVATGTNGEPVVPSWPGMDGFPGTVLHSSAFRNGAPFEDKDVLVVGFGNSGGEIALDLLDHGARPTVSVRSPVNVVPRDILGIPVLAIALPLSKIPPGVADLLVRPLLAAYYPSYRRLGLRKADHGPFRQIAEGRRIPLLDIGTVREIRRGRIEVRSGIQRFERDTVKFVDGRKGTFDAVILATGYRPTLPAGVDEPTSTTPERESARAPGLYFCGFYVSPTGMIREVALEARRIVARIAGEDGRPGRMR